MEKMQAAGALELSAVVRKEGELYVALCPEVDVASQGGSAEEAIANLREALELYFEDEDVEKPIQTEAPIVTIVRVRVHSPTGSLRMSSD